jgi:glycosyltransferase involved in cell wall biosynthesis
MTETSARPFTDHSRPAGRTATPRSFEQLSRVRVTDAPHGSLPPPSGEVSNPTVSVIIPALNEERNLPHVLAALPERLHQVILVDGGSTDRTIEVARKSHPGIRIISQTRSGKGNALACGFAVATGDFIVTMDADGSTDPAEIPRFVEALRQGADFAKGSRFIQGAGSSDISRFRQFGNSWLIRLVNLLYGTRYTDLCYGYNAFRRDCLETIGLEPVDTDPGQPHAMLWGDGFEVETLINVRIAKARLRVCEVPSFESSRLYGRSNLNAISDGIRVLRTIHIERKRGTRWVAAQTASAPRRSGATWAMLSTFVDEIG